MEDVAIVGAGPAGATLGALLAARGVRVAVFDRDAFPRDKLCGEFLSYDALPVLEPLGVVDAIDRAGAPVIDRCRVVGSRRIYEFAFPHPARGVSRLFLDDLLLRTAAERGAERRDGVTVTDLGEVNARVIVGAWGRWGRFDQQLQRGFVKDRTHRNFGFKRHYTELVEGTAAVPAEGTAAVPAAGPAASRRRPESETLSDQPARTPAVPHKTTIDLYAFRRGYLGVNDVEGGVTNICGLVHASRLTHHKGRWDAFVETLRAEEPRLEELYARYEPAQENFLSSEPVIFRARSAVEGGIFMIGDASGVIDPLTGNGMAMAVQSALLAAPLLLRLLEQPSRRPEIEDEYRRRHHAFFAPRIAWSRRVAALLSRPRLLDAALATLGGTSLGQTFLRRTRASRDEVSRLAEAWFR